MSSGDLVRLADVRVVRDRQTILDIPALTLAPGELLTVIGANGAGKSTLLRVLALVLAPTTGQVYFDGVPAHPGRVGSAGLAAMRRRVDSAGLLAMRRRVTMVFQNPVLLARTVRSNVAAGLQFRNLPRAEVDSQVDYWLDRLGIAELGNRHPQGLSGGEAQRVALARALVLKPDLLLLDEPTANLDAPTRARLLGDLRGILAEVAAGAVLVTHEVREAPYFADRMIVMGSGMIRQQGRPDVVIDNPADRETASFLGFDNILPATLLEPAAYLGPELAGKSFCIRPEDVAAAPLAALPAAARDGGIRFAATVSRIAPWGPAFRVSGPLERAPAVTMSGTAAAAVVRDGLVREGGSIAFEFNPAAGAFVGQS